MFLENRKSLNGGQDVEGSVIVPGIFSEDTAIPRHTVLGKGEDFVPSHSSRGVVFGYGLEENMW